MKILTDNLKIFTNLPMWTTIYFILVPFPLILSFMDSENKNKNRTGKIYRNSINIKKEHKSRPKMSRPIHFSSCPQYIKEIKAKKDYKGHL